MQIDIPELSVVALIGTSASGKDGFVKKYFKEEEVLSFDELYNLADERLRDAKLTVVNITNVQEKTLEAIKKLSKRYHCLSVAIIFNTPELSYEEDDKTHIGKQVKEETIKDPAMQMESLVQSLQKKGFKDIYILSHQEEIDNAQVTRTKLSNNKKDIHGPFDIIGDIHGCYDELCELLEKLDCVVDRVNDTAYSAQGRKIVFLGDLVDRGPQIPKVLRLVMSMVKEGRAYCVLGNHDGKLQRKLRGSNVQVIHGLEKTVEQLAQETEQFIKEVSQFLDGLVSHYVFDEGKLVVVHAGLKEKLQGRESAKVRNLAMFGETTGEVDELGLPVRLNWTDEYGGSAFVVYGHTPQLSAKIINNTVNIDTGCVFGGRLTAFRYPEKEIVDVKAKMVYYEPARPLFNIKSE